MTNEDWVKMTVEDFETDRLLAQADTHADEVESLRVNIEGGNDPCGDALDAFDQMTDEEKWDTFRSDCEVMDADEIDDLR